MWSIKVLNGVSAGQTFPLKNGENTIGRSQQADICLADKGVSKRHACITVEGSKLTLNDLGSSNGTFVNGILIQSQQVYPEDKLAFHSTLIAIVPTRPAQQGLIQFHNPNAMPPPQAMNGFPPQQAYAMQGNAAFDQNFQPHASMDGQPQAADQVKVHQGLRGVVDLVQNYVDSVVLPGVYKLAEWFEFKWVLGLFIAAFILFVTSLSSVPMMTILRESIQKESQNRALTIAKSLVRINASKIDTPSTLTVDAALREPGVDKAFIISEQSSDFGSILAPVSQRGSYPDVDFIATARKLGRAAVKQVNDSLIVAVVPIEQFNPVTNTQGIVASAVVVYNMGVLAVNDERTLSLFIQTFFIALLIGAVLFFFLYKLIDWPYRSLNKQIDAALNDKSSTLEIRYDFPELQKLVSNINSALSRMSQASDDSEMGSNIEFDRSQEMEALVHLSAYPAIAIKANDESIAALNPDFENRTGLSSSELLYGDLESITDNALKLSLRHLIGQAASNPSQTISDRLPISGIDYDITCQAVYGQQAVAYYLVYIMDINDYEEGLG